MADAKEDRRGKLGAGTSRYSAVIPPAEFPSITLPNNSGLYNLVASNELCSKPDPEIDGIVDDLISGKRQEIVIGRKNQDINRADDFVSRRHAKIMYISGEIPADLKYQIHLYKTESSPELIQNHIVTSKNLELMKQCDEIEKGIYFADSSASGGILHVELGERVRRYIFPNQDILYNDPLHRFVPVVTERQLRSRSKEMKFAYAFGEVLEIDKEKYHHNILCVKLDLDKLRETLQRK